MIWGNRPEWVGISWWQFFYQFPRFEKIIFLLGILRPVEFSQWHPNCHPKNSRPKFFDIIPIMSYTMWATYRLCCLTLVMTRRGQHKNLDYLHPLSLIIANIRYPSVLSYIIQVHVFGQPWHLIEWGLGNSIYPPVLGWLSSLFSFPLQGFDGLLPMIVYFGSLSLKSTIQKKQIWLQSFTTLSSNQGNEMKLIKQTLKSWLG